MYSSPGRARWLRRSGSIAAAVAVSVHFAHSRHRRVGHSALWGAKNLAASKLVVQALFSLFAALSLGPRCDYYYPPPPLALPRFFFTHLRRKSPNLTYTTLLYNVSHRSCCYCPLRQGRRQERVDCSSYSWFWYDSPNHRLFTLSDSPPLGSAGISELAVFHPVSCVVVSGPRLN